MRQATYVLSGFIQEPNIRHSSLGPGLQTCHLVPYLGFNLQDYGAKNIDVFPTGFFFIPFYTVLTIPVWIISLFKHAQSYQKLLHQPMCAIASVCSSHPCARPSACWKSVIKDVLFQFHWLFEHQSRRSHKCKNEGHGNLSEGKQIEKKMEKIS